jgi:hypothetical protein
MTISGVEKLSKKPVFWPKNGLVFSFGDVCFKAEKIGKDNKTTYEILLVVYSAIFATFLDAVAKVQIDIATCPRVRRVPGTSDIAVFGQSSWSVLKPGFVGKVDETCKVDMQDYRSGMRLLRFGYDTLLEENLVRAMLEFIKVLDQKDGLLQVHMPEGFIAANCAGFEFFYGFVYACHRAGKTEKECYEILSRSGIPMQYPASFDIARVSQTDIKTIYNILSLLIH